MEENIQLSFFGTKESETDDVSLRIFANIHKDLYIGVKDRNEVLEHHICLSRATAIRLSKELKKQISYLREEDSNE